MELQEIISKMESDGWKIADDFKIAHGHFLQYFLETVEQALRIHDVSQQSEQLCDDWIHEERVKRNDDKYCPICGKKLQ